MPEAGMEVAAERLRSLVERIERLSEEKKSLFEDIAEIFSEAKGAALRRLDKADRDEQESILETYKRALGL